MKDVPREPEHYSPTVHAGQQAKHRGIGWQFVSETIKDWSINPSPKADCVLFIKEFISQEKPIGVVANYVDGVIITVEYRH